MAGGIGMNEYVHVLSSDSSFLSQSFFPKLSDIKLWEAQILMPSHFLLTSFHCSDEQFQVLIFAAMYNKLFPSTMAISQLDY